MEWVLLISVLTLVLGAEFVNGWTDAPNAIATVVSTRVLSPSKAVVMAVVLNIVGAMSGTAVAETVGKGIVKVGALDLLTLGSAVVTVIVWGSVAWRYGLPISKSHALFSGLAGAAMATAGPSALIWSGWQKILIGLAFSTVLGFVGGFFLITAVLRLFHRSTPHKVRGIFGRLQILSAAFMAFSHGSNDGQKFIGVFTLALMLGAPLTHMTEFRVTWPVIIACSLVMGIGTSVGGWRIMRTMGVKITRLEPHHGFAAETAAGTCIELASRLGIPLSTTHTISTAIMGVGASRKASAVRWGVAGEVVTAWILTFPVCGLLAWGFASAAAAIRSLLG
jgi:PiT family inorganic phosphate transporter